MVQAAKYRKCDDPAGSRQISRWNWDSLRRSVLKHVAHDYNRNAGIVSLWDDARIFIGQFKDEKDVDNYFGHRV